MMICTNDKDYKLNETHLADWEMGSVLPVVYDTAWVSRVPQLRQLSEPAFPRALDWLRQQQLADGSWGDTFPQYAHSNTLNILAAILALAQWQKDTDRLLIERGLFALEHLAPKLKNERYETIGFELLLPAMVRECEFYNLKLSAETLKHYAVYQKKYEKKQQLIAQLQLKNGATTPSSWWFSLEMLGGNKLTDKNIELPCGKFMLAANGSVASSPAATAYLLAAARFRGQDFPHAFHYLETLQQQKLCNYAAPNVSPINGFELSFGSAYLLEAGVPHTDAYIQNALKQLISIWRQYDGGGLGYSSYFIIDPDESAMAIRVLSAAGYKEIDPKVLLQYFNGSYIENFKGETTPSISANLHTVSALHLLPQTAAIRDAITSILVWLEQQANTEGPVFCDKWHFSAIYPISRAVTALEKLHNSLARRCVDWLIAEQHADGGWGTQGMSTLEETAFAALALTHWYNKGHNLSLTLLKRARDYLENQPRGNSKLAFWIGKVLYCPYRVVATLIMASRIALDNTLV